MAYEQTELVYKDLCSRVPYGVAYHWKGKTTEDDMPHFLNGMNEWMIFYIQQGFIKPYLRSMSSMTEKEQDEWYNVTYQAALELVKKKQLDNTPNALVNMVSIDWLNARHFDYRGLIGKGLAIEITKDNNPYV